MVEQQTIIALLLVVLTCFCSSGRRGGCYWCCHGLAAARRRGRTTSGTGFGVAPPSSTTSSSSYVPDTSPEIQTLKGVLQQQKAVLDGTDIGLCSNGRQEQEQRGLYATKNFSKDKVICKIPSDLALALSDPNDDSDAASAPTLPEAGANLMKLYYNNDNWKFYLDCLPKQQDQQITTMTPDFWEDDEIALLEFPRLVTAVRKRMDELDQVLEQNPTLDRTALQWATYLVSSRHFPLAISEPDQDGGLETEAGDIALDDRGQVITKAGERKYLRVLVPYLDMVNHKSSTSSNAKWTVLDPQKDDAWFALVATRNIAAGKEITISYGSQVDSSVELLLNYGFVEPGNPFDKFMLEKGGEDCLRGLDEWTTTLEEDRKLLDMASTDPSMKHLQTILQFRIQLKQSYSDD